MSSLRAFKRRARRQRLREFFVRAKCTGCDKLSGRIPIGYPWGDDIVECLECESKTVTKYNTHISCGSCGSKSMRKIGKAKSGQGVEFGGRCFECREKEREETIQRMEGTRGKAGLYLVCRECLRMWCIPETNPISGQMRKESELTERDCFLDISGCREHGDVNRIDGKVVRMEGEYIENVIETLEDVWKITLLQQRLKSQETNSEKA